MQRTQRNIENISNNINADNVTARKAGHLVHQVKKRLAFGNVGNAEKQNLRKPVQKSQCKNLQDVKCETKTYKVTPHIKASNVKNVKKENLPDESGDVINMSIERESKIVKDVSDTSKQFFLPEYVEDIYNYLFELEQALSIQQNYYRSMTYVSSKVRTIVVDWIMQICKRFQLITETFQLAVSLLDRYLQVVDVKRNQIQVAACCAVMIASKFEEMLSPAYDDFMYVSDGVFNKSDIKKMEIEMLVALDVRICRPVPLQFLRRFARLTELDEFRYTASKYLIEMSLIDSKLCHILPSRISASAMCLSIKLSSDMEWTNQLIVNTRYAESELTPVMQRMCMNLRSIKKHDHWHAVFNKYASNSMFGIAKHAMFSENPRISSFADGRF